ncbi:hypothetical protein [Streptosporangium sp. NPDC049078]|uniref:hypothetical protein n=1 Tax=Streptosporangium sp. NPDC049078 TaxID=3155767 RepID=UPI0034424349
MDLVIMTSVLTLPALALLLLPFHDESGATPVRRHLPGFLVRPLWWLGLRLVGGRVSRRPPESM